MTAAGPRRPRVAFLFLGETLLIPHLYPIVEALAAEAPGMAIDCWVSTGVHEALLGRWLNQAGLGARVRVRRAPGFAPRPAPAPGQNPVLPAKLPMLLRLLPALARADVTVCAEQTSLWLARMFPFLRMRFVKTSHGVGSMSARDDPRRRAAHRLLVPSAAEKATYTRRDHADERVVVTGYVKSAFRALAPRVRLFADDRPVILYAPHWQRHRSSWWAWGRDVVTSLAEQDRFNVILAPHQRLVETAPDMPAILAAVADRPHVHVDTGSFAMVDGSYLAAADLYLGDTSSQVVEFLARPRPCVFLNPERLDWRATDDHGFWTCGTVVERLADLPAALASAEQDHPRFASVQRGFAAESLGVTGPQAAVNAARAVIDALR